MKWSEDVDHRGKTVSEDFRINYVIFRQLMKQIDIVFSEDAFGVPDRDSLFGIFRLCNVNCEKN